MLTHRFRQISERNRPLCTTHEKLLHQSFYSVYRCLCMCKSHLCSSSHHCVFSSFCANLHQGGEVLNPDVKRTCFTCVKVPLYSYLKTYFSFISFIIFILYLFILKIDLQLHKIPEMLIHQNNDIQLPWTYFQPFLRSFSDLSSNLFFLPEQVLV